MNSWMNAEVGAAMLTLMLLGAGCRDAGKDKPSGAAVSATAGAARRTRQRGVLQDAPDAQASLSVPNIKATTAVLASPENLAASRHMKDHCGIKMNAFH